MPSIYKKAIKNTFVVSLFVLCVLAETAQADATTKAQCDAGGPTWEWVKEGCCKVADHAICSNDAPPPVPPPAPTTSSGSKANTDFVPLVGIPNITVTKDTPLPDYINKIYLLTIGVGALIAVIKLMIAGVKWSMDDIVSHKSEAKKEIWGTLFGVALLLVPFIVLNTINPDLVSLNILGRMDPINAPPAPQNQTPANPGVPTTQAACQAAGYNWMDNVSVCCTSPLQQCQAMYPTNI